jgi:CheY-like chemotaxis protein
MRAAQAQRMQALGQLAGGIAHDFNNILQVVQGGATLIANRSTDQVSVKKFAAAMLGAVERGASITRRLLAFARRGELRAERIDPAGLLDGLRDVLAQTLGSPITVRINNDGIRLPAVMADRGQLETVLVNLATNARDAMPGGGTLTFAAVPEEVTVSRIHPAGLEPGPYVRLSVADTGTGMDRATLARAMEPFFTTKPQDKGTGLGLSMAKGFAEQSGGALAIDSAPGRGTTVMLWLPIPDEQQKAAQMQPGLAPVAGLARRILVVDDEDLVRETLVATLEDAGFVVVAAGSGAEALALVKAGESLDAMVSDMAMPGMDGLALIRTVYQQRPDLPAILLTGFAGEASQLITGTASHTFSLLRKPVSVPQLIDRIEAVLAAKARI